MGGHWSDFGGVSGNGWGLSLTGDTFSAPWVFTISPNANLGQLRLLVLDGLNALTVFDRTSPSPGTAGSAAGFDWSCLAGSCDTAIVTYDYAVGIGAAAPVGDLWQVVSINFFVNDADQGPRADFSFRQDTDNDARQTQVPEPGVVGLLGLALAALGFMRRRLRALS